MVISKYNRQLIENNLRRYYDFLSIVNENDDKILSATGTGESSGASKNGYSDVTGEKAVRLCEDTKIKKWIRITEKVIEKFKNTLTYEVLEGRYFKDKNISQIKDEISVEQATIYRMREDIIIYTAMLAIQEGLIKI